jgi:hypothetical protein
LFNLGTCRSFFFAKASAAVVQQQVAVQIQRQVKQHKHMHLLNVLLEFLLLKKRKGSRVQNCNLLKQCCCQVQVYLNTAYQPRPSVHAPGQATSWG